MVGNVEAGASPRTSTCREFLRDNWQESCPCLQWQPCRLSPLRGTVRHECQHRPSSSDKPIHQSAIRRSGCRFQQSGEPRTGGRALGPARALTVQRLNAVYRAPAYGRGAGVGRGLGVGATSGRRRPCRCCRRRRCSSCRCGSCCCGGCSCCCRRRCRRRRRRGRCRGCRARSASQIKRADSQSPSNGASRGNVLIYVPESGVIARINYYCRVVTPTSAACLRAGAVDDRSFAQGHLTRRIAVVAGGVKHARKRLDRVRYPLLRR